MSKKSWISVVTLLLVGLILFFSRNELERAFMLLGQIDLWIFALILPLQVISYFLAGEMMFSYLRSKGSISSISPLRQIGMALEMNFVNHTLPSGGVSGISYMTWRLSTLGISPARAAAAQLVRFSATFMAFITLLVVAVLVITVDGSINRWILLLSATLVFVMGGGIVLLSYIVGNKARIERTAKTLTRWANRIIRVVTLGRYKRPVHKKLISDFLYEIHDEYVVLRRERHILVKPYLWGIIFTVAEVLLFVVTFWALGITVNPATILIAYGLASIAGFIVVTPGGAGAYEAIMVWFLAISGVAASSAIAGIVLTRVAVLLGTIVFGYLFYQRTIMQHGTTKRPS